MKKYNDTYHSEPLLVYIITVFKKTTALSKAMKFFI